MNPNSYILEYLASQPDLAINARYLALFTSQYQNSPNLLNFANGMLNLVQDLVKLLGEMYQFFDIDYAIGDQLDILGEIVGANRLLPFTPTPVGSPAVAVSPILTDDNYRILIKATIGINQWDGKMSSIKPLWNSLFPAGSIVVQDNLDMTMSVTPVGSFNSVIIDMIQNDMIVPRPEGVKMYYNFGQMPFFGFDLLNTYIAGFDAGHWA